jgi:hypothetical protein
MNGRPFPFLGILLVSLLASTGCMTARPTFAPNPGERFSERNEANHEPRTSSAKSATRQKVVVESQPSDFGATTTTAVKQTSATGEKTWSRLFDPFPNKAKPIPLPRTDLEGSAEGEKPAEFNPQGDF